jgi:HK97 family phage prohead protease
MKDMLYLVTRQIETDSGGEIYEGVATTAVKDRLNEIVNPKGCINLQDYLANPVLLWQHDPNRPIGKVINVEVSDDAIKVQFVFASTQFAQEIKQLVDEGIVRGLSIGFIPRRVEGNIYVDWEWIETSVVTLPANPRALIQKESDGDMELVKKGIVPDSDAEFPLYEDFDREWDADESEKRWRKYVGVETNEDLQDKEKQRKYAKRFFWADDERLDTFGAYKLPHVDIVDGKPYAIWRGVVAAMAALLGARGGVDIPEEDREKVYRAIAKYYRKADKEPPEFKSYTPEELKLIEACGWENPLAYIRKSLEQLRSELERALLQVNKEVLNA